MPWYIYVAHYFGGAFLANAIPHFVNGVSGRPFQSPFAKPPGVGLSSAVVNVVWGFANLIVAYLLLVTAGVFRFGVPADAAVFGGGVLVMALMLANTFGRTNGGRLPR
jgi:hypothetical protein